MHITYLKRLWNKAKHNAFSDLCAFQGKLYCCFREAHDHVSGDGNIRVLELNWQGDILGSQHLSLAQADLRDPKLSVTPDGKLLLIAYARQHDGDDKHLYSQCLCWSSADGLSWSSATEFAEKNWWLWRLTWHQGQAFGLAYNRSKQALNLYTGDPRRTFNIHCHNAFSLAREHKGYPNESDIIFIDEVAYALVRRDADSYSAQLGHSRFPYTQWTWQDLACYIGGPAMLVKDKHSAYVTGRIEYKGKLRTALMSLDLDKAKLSLDLVLPSAGDNSYPGLLKQGDSLFMSYYSCHQDNQSQIYLAKIQL
jgi:hypothetical protein